MGIESSGTAALGNAPRPTSRPKPIQPLAAGERRGPDPAKTLQRKAVGLIR